jgi:site-specific DNA-methyltransferase (adenine-specific)
MGDASKGDFSSGWRLLHGDARRQLREVPERCVVVTDPVWPNAPAGMFPGVKATALARRVFSNLVAGGNVRRLVIVLGCDSDPRWLAEVVPVSLPFVRTCWLRHVVPVRAGTILRGSDVAYVYGDHRTVRPRRVLPGEAVNSSSVPRDVEAGAAHPCPRRLAHMLWLVDPFAGSCTTGVAALRFGRRFLGCEIVAAYAAEGEERLRAEVRGQSLAQARSGQETLFAAGAA